MSKFYVPGFNVRIVMFNCSLEKVGTTSMEYDSTKYLS